MSVPDNYSKLASFEEGGYTFHAYQPDNHVAERVLIVRAYKDDEAIKEITVPMAHSNPFGVDVEDMIALEQKTNDLVTELVYDAAD